MRSHFWFVMPQIMPRQIYDVNIKYILLVSSKRSCETVRQTRRNSRESNDASLSFIADRILSVPLNSFSKDSYVMLPHPFWSYNRQTRLNCSSVNSDPYLAKVLRKSSYERIPFLTETLCCTLWFASQPQFSLKNSFLNVSISTICRYLTEVLCAASSKILWTISTNAPPTQDAPNRM